MKTTSLIVLLGLALATALNVSAHAKTLVFCASADTEGFNPQLFTSASTFDASARTVYNRLLQFERGTLDLEPALAESWQISDDGLDYTFTLRRGVKFHQTAQFLPSRDFNADDVLFSFLRQLDAEHPYHPVSGGRYESFRGMRMSGLLRAITKLNDHTVRFSLQRPHAPFLSILAMDFASILSAEYAQAQMAAGTPERLDLDPVGTGPFQLRDYEKGKKIQFVAHIGYWGGMPAIQKLVFAITPKSADRYEKLMSGECHIMSHPRRNDLDKLAKNPAIALLNTTAMDVGYLAFNTQKPPFDQALVRQALSMAIDKPSLVEAVYRGKGTPANGPLPPAVWSYNATVADYAYDPQMARQHLESAGLGDGFKMQLWAMPVSRPYNPDANRMAKLLQTAWLAIGVEVEIVSFDWGEYLKRSRDGEHDAVLLGWTGDNGDPDYFLAELLGCDAVGGSNRAHWCYQPFEDLIQQARVLSLDAERGSVYAEAQALFAQEAPWIPIAHSVIFQPVRKEVQGFRIDPRGGHDFFGVDLTTVEASH
ncbi:MAG TPA: ABC transporter substrate-binding protein [Gammaproteobacteria bacterium]|jgi:dipeptide transport system substrate-binding protein|nr:ABC transporter substrate-binding protein [Gammaproteobacteria bacterium]